MQNIVKGEVEELIANMKRKNYSPYLKNRNGMACLKNEKCPSCGKNKLFTFHHESYDLEPEEWSPVKLDRV